MILNAGHPERYRLKPEIVDGEVCDGVDIEGDKRIYVELILAVTPLASLARSGEGRRGASTSANWNSGR
jgi:hypothetical protein